MLRDVFGLLDPRLVLEFFGTSLDFWIPGWFLGFFGTSLDFWIPGWFGSKFSQVEENQKLRKKTFCN